MKIIISGVLLLGCATTYASEPTIVFGLPIGGKLADPVRACSYTATGRTAVMPTCWIYSTSGGSASKRGQLHVHGQDKMPSWAAAASFDAVITRDGTLSEITVVSKPPSDATKIMESISARFGRPSHTDLHDPTKWAALWDTPTIRISLICNASDSCHTRLVSHEVAAAELKRVIERAKIDAARPISP